MGALHWHVLWQVAICALLIAVLLGAARQPVAMGQVKEVLPQAAQVLSPLVQPRADVLVRVDRSTPDGMSHLALGVTHMQYSLDPWGDSEAVQRGQALLAGVTAYQNQHIMGFGAHNPQPEPGKFDWTSLDQRVAMMRASGSTPVITLCCAPTWMVDSAWRGGTDWSKLEWAPLPEHETDFAALAQQVALRYPDVQHFIVWNEFKGMWNARANTWDYQRYTRLYNLVYDAVKSVRPEALVGGPYLVIEGTGSERGHWWSQTPVRVRNLQVIDYWLRNKHGADFIALDRSIQDFHDYHVYSEAEHLRRTYLFGHIVAQIKQRPGYKGEPIWFVEDYFKGSPNWQYQAAGLASMLYHELKAGVAVSLRWEPQAQPSAAHGGNNQNLFTSTLVPGGGQALPNYHVYQAFSRHFGPGTPLFHTFSSSPNIEVLASETHTLLINKQSEAVVVDVDGSRVTLGGYAVQVLDHGRQRYGGLGAWHQVWR